MAAALSGAARMNIIRAVLVAIVVVCHGFSSAAHVQDHATHGQEQGWIDLTAEDDLSAWKTPHGAWRHVSDVAVRSDNPRLLAAPEGTGPILYNGPTGRTPNLLSRRWFADIELHAEFLVPRGSNSGIKFLGLYEIQIADSHGKPEVTASDCGGIYPRAELLPSYHHIDHGYPPARNAAKPAGEWQTLDVVFRAPRFDQTGKKVRPARFEKVLLNDMLIHENVEVPNPTGHAWHKPDIPEGPLLLQGDHGPVAFRNVRVRTIDGAGRMAARDGQTAGAPAHGGSINRQFLDPALNVQNFVNRFEAEDRDIFQNRAAIARAVGLKPGQSVADIGAGTGLFTNIFATQVGPEGKVYAVDIAQPFLDHIAAHARQAGLTQVETVRSSAETCALPEASIDVAFICDTYHHFENHAAMLASIHRALRPGGRLVLVEFDRREGISSEFVLSHIRASQGQFKREIQEAGFREVPIEDPPALRENFIAAFERTDAPDQGGAPQP